MTRFETTEGFSLGQKFSGGRLFAQGRSNTKWTWFASPAELELLWSLPEDTPVVNDNGSPVETVGELLDLFSQTPMCPADDMARRGWGDRLESGLGLRMAVGEDGRVMWTR